MSEFVSKKRGNVRSPRIFPHRYKMTPEDKANQARVRPEREAKAQARAAAGLPPIEHNASYKKPKTLRGKFRNVLQRDAAAFGVPTMVIGGSAVVADQATKDRVRKLDRNPEAQKAALAATAGTGAYMATGYGLKSTGNRARRNYETRLKMRADLGDKKGWEDYNAKQKAHQAKFGIEGNLGSRKNKHKMQSQPGYARTYPLGAPGARRKRIVGYMTGKPGMAIGGTFAAVPAAVSIRNSRKKIEKRDTSTLELGYGAGALGSVAGYNKIATGVDRLRARKPKKAAAEAESRYERLKAAKPAKGGDPAEFKAWKKSIGQAQTGAEQARSALKKAPKVTAKQKAFGVYGATLTGVPALWHGGREKFAKRTEKQKNYDKQFGAGVAGALIPQVGANLTDKLDNHYDRKIKAHEPSKKTTDAHRAKHGNPKEFGDPRWNKLYETYPLKNEDGSKVPGGRYRRVAARTLAGKGIWATTAATTGGAVGLERLRQQRQKNQVAKNMKAITAGAKRTHQGAPHRNVVSPGQRGYHGRYEMDDKFPFDENVKVLNSNREILEQNKKTYQRPVNWALGIGAGSAGLSAALLEPGRRRTKADTERRRGTLVKKGAGTGRDVFFNVVNPNRKGVYDINLPKPPKPGWRERAGKHMNENPELTEAVWQGAALGGIGVGSIGSMRAARENNRVKAQQAAQRRAEMRAARRNAVAKSGSFGYETTRLSPLRATEAAVGVTLMAYGGSRNGMLGRALARGARTPGNRQVAYKHAERLRGYLEDTTGRGAQMLKQRLGTNMKLRNSEALIGGGALTYHALPIHQKKFTATGRPPAPMQYGGF